MLKSILGISGSDYKRIAPALFAYLFDKIDMERFVAYVDPDDRSEGTRIKDIARVNGYILKNCKLYAYACHCARIEGNQMPTPRSYEVTTSDSLLLKQLNLRHLNPKMYSSFSLVGFDKTIQQLITSYEITNYTGRFVTKKMSFLMKSYGERREDIEAYLHEQAIIAVYKQYPRYESYLHMMNVAKAQIHNKGQTFITSSTAKSRQRLMHNAAGLPEAVHVSLDSVADLPAPPKHDSEILEGLSALSQIEHQFPPRTKEFLMCAAGQYHEGLSEFLKRSNDELIEMVTYTKYLDKVQAFFGVTQENTEKLFSKIRTKILSTAK